MEIWKIHYFNLLLIFEPFKRLPHKMVKFTQTIHWLLPTNCLSVFDHFVGLSLKGLTQEFCILNSLLPLTVMFWKSPVLFRWVSQNERTVSVFHFWSWLCSVFTFSDMKTNEINIIEDDVFTFNGTSKLDYLYVAVSWFYEWQEILQILLLILI